MDKLIISNLSKTYKYGVKALDNVNLEIGKGMFGLLGPNGAGKSSLMRTIATLQEADEGSITLNGLDVIAHKMEVRKILGYLPQQFGLFPKISAIDLLDHFAILKGITNKIERKEMVSALLEKTNLYAVRKQNLGGFSGGMKQRFGIAQALLSNPKLVIVDEPTAGLDPKERNQFYYLLSEIGEDAIIILSTHIVDDVKELCTKMAIINQGKVILQGEPLKLIDQVKGKVYQKLVHKSEIAEYRKVHHVINEQHYLGQPLIQIITSLDPPDGFTPSQVGLEEVYFSQLIQAHK
ncbi:ABC transporter ATP-binding protein [Portibacter lacus]|uniref:Multidrug ABC transporter ATP-binding protein n=1 Tax=Portibacter lacus TaxID=1099794 RepID=A0AA37WFA7_9BACT|nr:ABC transporter ATP-binding protein [Portibacter lacus]GLR16830.1 multidrug ABC transporter ATP-binding protein [Portibacter lacus]